MKISEFKINKKITFSNGEIDVKSNDKEVNFKELNISLLNTIQNEILSKVDDNSTDNKILYLILPYLTDLEMDVSFEEFQEMVSLPSAEFVQLCEAIIDEIIMLFETSKRIEKLNKKSKEIKRKFKNTK